jgi:proline iminopeptidase
MNSHSTLQRVWRVVAAALLIALGVLAAPAAAIAAFLLAATWSDSIPVLAAVAAAALIAVCAPLVWLAGRLAFRRRARVVALALTGALVAVAALGAASTVFRPIGIESPGAQASAVEFWDLPTGSRLAYTRLAAEGPAVATPVIRLHGGPGTPGDGPDDLDRALAATGYDVYVYDQVGSGRSERLADPTEYTVARQVADLEAVRAAIGADRVVLIGGSWGASLGAAYAAEYPSHVAALVFGSPGVLWAPAWDGQSEGDLWDRLTPEQERQLDALESEGGARLLLWSVLMEVNPRAAHALIPDEEIDAVFARLIGIAGSAASCDAGRPVAVPSAVPGFYANQLVSQDQDAVPDPRPGLREVDVPVLVLRGECDYKRWEIAREYRDTFPDATLVYVPGAGHAIDLDEPELYVATVTAFLAGRELPLEPYMGEREPAG